MRLAPFLRGTAAIFAFSVFSAETVSAQILWDNGPVVDGTGRSVVRPGGTILGIGAQLTTPNLVADNFTVGSAWNVTGLSLFSYQTGASSQFTFTNVVWSIVSGDVNTGAVVASGSTAPTNGGLMGYRVTAAAFNNTDRAIFQLDLDVADFGLGVGSYWLRWGIAGTLGSGPWQPPTSDGVVGDAMQSEVNAPYVLRVDDGDGLGMEYPFLIHGTAATVVPEPSTWAMMLMGGAGLFGMARRRQVRE